VEGLELVEKKKKKIVIASKKEKGFASDHVVFWIQLSSKKKSSQYIVKAQILCVFSSFFGASVSAFVFWILQSFFFVRVCGCRCWSTTRVAFFFCWQH
jgi:hypothetical protein